LCINAQVALLILVGGADTAITVVCVVFLVPIPCNLYVSYITAHAWASLCSYFLAKIYWIHAMPGSAYAYIVRVYN